MTQWAPVWRVSINAVEYTDVILANLSISTGRTNIYTQAQAGYATINLINLNLGAIDIEINDSVTVEIQDTSATFVPIFGGSVVDIAVTVSQVGSVAITQEVTITALGALSRLQKALTNGVLSIDYDGNQIKTILTDLLADTWNEVPAALTWATYTPATTTWADANNSGIGEVDTPGNYELDNRGSSQTVVWNLVADLATSGLGYIYENPQGQVCYADSTHRSTYLATYGYTELTANQALGRGIKIQTKAGDIRNDVSIVWKSGTESATDADSIALYGDLAQQITTSLNHAVDAQSQADFYLTLRAKPQAFLESITFALTNPELDNADRDSLINVFMGQPISLSDLPVNMQSGNFLGFVEGWKFQASYNQVSITLIISPLPFSLQAMEWSDVSVVERFNTLSATLDYADALVVN
jgi:hypothetical protein